MTTRCEHCGGINGESIGMIQFRGFAVNGRECEEFLGEAFETHLPSEDQIMFRGRLGELGASVGDWIVRDARGIHIERSEA